MSDLCFVFASTAEKNADKIINKYLKDTDLMSSIFVLLIKIKYLKKT